MAQPVYASWLAAALILAAGATLAPAPPYLLAEDGPGDGRLNSGWGGDYFLYCQGGLLEVWRLIEKTSKGELVARFPLSRLDLLHQQGDSLHDSQSGITVTRWGDKTEVSGWNNGNNRSGRNSQVFNSKDCQGQGPGPRDDQAKQKVAELTERARRLGFLIEFGGGDAAWLLNAIRDLERNPTPQKLRDFEAMLSFGEEVVGIPPGGADGEPPDGSG